MNRLFVALTVVLQLALPAPEASAHEDFTEINVIIGAHSTRLNDGAYDYFSTQDWMTSGYLAAEVEVWDGLFVQLGILMSDSQEELFGEFDSHLRVREPRLAIRYGYAFFDWLRPYATAAATYAWMRTEINLWDSWISSYGDGWGEGELGGRLALGCELFLPRRIFAKDSGLFKDFTFGMALEAGYALTQPFDMDKLKHSQEGGDDPTLPQGFIDMGQLDRSGFFISYDMRVYF